jgi:hypothetical protein
MSKRASNEPLSINDLLTIYLESKDTLGDNKSAELEIKFGTRKIKQITKNAFDNVIQQLLSNKFIFKGEPQYYLSIKTDNIRTEVHNLKNIQNYCRTNKLPDDYDNEGFSFTEKRPYTVGENGTRAVINVDPFNFRYTYSIEKILSPSSDEVQNLLKSWSISTKFYRLINRFTLVNDSFPVRIDLSIVRENLSESRNFKDSNILNFNLKYEIEIEIINEMLPDSITNKELDIILKKVSKYILSGLQGTNYPTSYTEQDLIIQDYLHLVKGPEYRKEVIGTPRDFIGPSSITLQVANIVPKNKDTNIVNVRDNYVVTDKADGDRKMLYVAKTGKIYLITTQLNVEFTGAETKNNKLFDSLLDGEHIKHNKKGEFINLYAVFDIYFRKNEDVRRLKFSSSGATGGVQTRWDLLQLVCKDMGAVLINTNNLSPIRISPKQFYEVSKNLSIFAACNHINEQIKSGQMEYLTDGIIFTSTNLGVGLDKPEQPPKSYKHTWKYSLKWKPAEFNTIDFFVTTKKLQTGAEFIGNKFEGGLDVAAVDQIVQYKTIILRVGFDIKKHGYINPCQNIINDNYPARGDVDDRDSYKPVQFFPSNPYDADAGITNIELRLDSTNEKQMFTEENEVIEDNTIVEFRYDMTRPKQWRWIPLRIRYDKTAEYREGFKNYGNAYHVAQSNWHSIHNPITLDMITTGKDIPNELADDDIYYNQLQGRKVTKALRDFHNLFVKNKLISSVSNPADTLIDYAAGKGGDIPKWIAANLSFVLGIDLSKDNIQNQVDGICARYLNYKQKFDIIPDALFIYGNSAKNIKDKSAAYTDKGGQIISAIFGEGVKDEKILGAGVVKAYGKGVDGFNISSIQFAVHYMFENGEMLHNFLMNIAECTKLGGYFIGTSYDGKRIFELLQKTKQNETFTVFDRDQKNKLLEITKRYDVEDFIDNVSCLGYGIDIFQASINKTFREYLVNYNYLISILENYGFVPLTVDESKAIGLASSFGNFEQLYNLMNLEIKTRKLDPESVGKAYRMTREEKTISFLNNYFIFKKVRNVDLKDIQIGLTGKSPKMQEEEQKATVLAQKEVSEVLAEAIAEKPKPRKTKKITLKPSKQNK